MNLIGNHEKACENKKLVNKSTVSQTPGMAEIQQRPPPPPQIKHKNKNKNNNNNNILCVLE